MLLHANLSRRIQLQPKLSSKAGKTLPTTENELGGIGAEVASGELEDVEQNATKDLDGVTTLETALTVAEG